MRVAIVGAGLSGLATARALLQPRSSVSRVRIFEAARDPIQARLRSARRHGTKLLLTSASRAALDQLQVEHNEISCRPLTYYDHIGSRALCTIDAVCTDVNALRQTLATDIDIEYDAPVTFNDIDASSTAVLIHGEPFDIVIGCDGRRSVLRPSMSDHLIQPERNLDTSRIIFDVPESAFGFVDTHDLSFVGNHCLATITRMDSPSRLRVSLAFPVTASADNDELPLNTFRRITHDWLQPLNRLADAVDDDSLVEYEILTDRDAPQLQDSYRGGPIALVGDALRALNPYSSQAGGVALSDAAAVAAVIKTDGSDLFYFWSKVQETAAPLVNSARSMMTFIHSGDAVDQLSALSQQQQQDRNDLTSPVMPSFSRT